MSIIKFCVINTKKQNLFLCPFLFYVFVSCCRGLSIYILLFYVFKQKVPAINTYKKKETGKDSYAILMKTVNQTTLV